MPSFLSSRNHPQRRVFRGRGGPRDGNLPPKRLIRRRVKYRPGGGGEEDEEDDEDDDDRDRADDINDDGKTVVDGGVVGRNREAGGEVGGSSISSLRRHARNLTLDENGGGDENVIDNDDQAIYHDDEKFLLEVEHLQRRIERISLSLKTCVGLSNPSTWRTNCLLPVRNVVREWKCILAFHHPEGTASSIYDNGGGREVERSSPPSVRNDGDGCGSVPPPAPRCIDVERNDLLLRGTSTKVFCLVQTSVQSGPLVGSNPGYFKRCGGEVASMAFAFLLEIVELAGVDSNEMMERECDRRRRSIRDGPREGASSGRRQAEGRFERRVGDANCHGDELSGGERFEEENCEHCRGEGSVRSCDISSSESDSSLIEYCDGDVTEYIHARIIDDVPTESKSTTPNDSVESTPCDIRGRAIIDGLQQSLLFTENQSRKFYQWLCNAHGAVEMNLPPSKSAIKLQSLRSKKQTLKELKIQRKLKKKKKEKKKTKTKGGEH
ncbi:hypothetical protein ACHAXA_004196 [Cyclostephanos tholiformis]|uniref:Uncharacterized protein n=1 Tax=Cyclostephanos tholiformis TaxID=382380 RepID=A0ABD3RBF1_9STRA